MNDSIYRVTIVRGDDNSLTVALTGKKQGVFVARQQKRIEHPGEAMGAIQEMLEANGVDFKALGEKRAAKYPGTKYKSPILGRGK